MTDCRRLALNLSSIKHTMQQSKPIIHRGLFHTLIELSEFISDFAAGIVSADRRAPQALSARGNRVFSPGIGPHNEDDSIRLVMDELSVVHPKKYSDFEVGTPYPADARSKIDLCLRPDEGGYEWAVELKMLRMLGDNGKPNDNMLMHILSPYPSHRSAVTDCKKILNFGSGDRKAIMIFGYESSSYPLAPAVDSFELIARQSVLLSQRESAVFEGLIHPVHVSGTVFGWEVLGPLVSGTGKNHQPVAGTQ